MVFWSKGKAIAFCKFLKIPNGFSLLHTLPFWFWLPPTVQHTLTVLEPPENWWHLAIYRCLALYTECRRGENSAVTEVNRSINFWIKLKLYFACQKIVEAICNFIIIVVKAQRVWLRGSFCSCWEYCWIRHWQYPCSCLRNSPRRNERRRRNA